ncbi:MAG: hypothetical protein ACLGSA_13450 [Acidobacteriota bacterium]
MKRVAPPILALVLLAAMAAHAQPPATAEDPLPMLPMPMEPIAPPVKELPACRQLSSMVNRLGAWIASKGMMMREAAEESVTEANLKELLVARQVYAEFLEVLNWMYVIDEQIFVVTQAMSAAYNPKAIPDACTLAIDATRTALLRLKESEHRFNRNPKSDDSDPLQEFYTFIPQLEKNLADAHKELETFAQTANKEYLSKRAEKLYEQSIPVRQLERDVAELESLIANGTLNEPEALRYHSLLINARIILTRIERLLFFHQTAHRSQNAATGRFFDIIRPLMYQKLYPSKSILRECRNAMSSFLMPEAKPAIQSTANRIMAISLEAEIAIANAISAIPELGFSLGRFPIWH